MTGCLDFRVEKGKWVRTGCAIAHLQLDSSIINLEIKLTRKYMEFQ